MWADGYSMVMKFKFKFLLLFFFKMYNLKKKKRFNLSETYYFGVEVGGGGYVNGMQKFPGQGSSLYNTPVAWAVTMLEL